MAEDKQLTVAELLARSRESKPDAEPPRRRRRRSLEEGGISVAELTGSFPAVEATPPESKHSSVPLDASPEDSDAERQAAEKAEAEKKAAEKAEAEKKAAEKAEAERKAAEKAEAEKKAAADKRAAEDRAILEEKARKEREAQEAETAAVKKPSADETTVISKITEQPKLKESAAPNSLTSASRAGATAADTTAIPTVRADAPKRRGYGDTATIDAVRIDDDDERYVDRQVEHSHDSEAEDWEDEGAGIATVIGMALVGVVIGVIVFIGLELMWGQLNSWFVTLLALAVTAVMVAVIRALRTGRDAAAMALAALVGLVMTFGPAILVL